MKYKMFVCDLDDTLLNDLGKIPEENIKAIKKLEEKGIKFVIATGRSKHLLEDFREILDYKMPVIWSNGSAVSDIDDKTLYTEEIDIEKGRKIIKLIYDYDVDYLIHTLDGVVAEKRTDRIGIFEDFNRRVKEEYRIPIIIDSSLYNNLEKYEILKLSTNADDDSELYKLQDAVNQNIKDVDAVFSGPDILDVTSHKASKGAATLKLAAMYNINPEEIIAIGDNENDISMLKVSGLPLAPENARESVKEFAAHITKNNHVGAVADAVERFIL